MPGLLKQLCDLLDIAWEDFVYDPATAVSTLFEVANIDKRWLPLLKPLVGFTKDIPFDATETELRRILARAVPFWSAKPSELGCVEHAIRMVTGNRYRARNYFDHRITTDYTCVTEELEDFDPTCIDFPSKCKRDLTILVGGGDPRRFRVTDGIDETFQTPYDYRFLVIEEPADLKGSYAIDHLVPYSDEPAGYTYRGEFPNLGYTECKGALYGAMDEYVTEVRVVDQRAGVMDFDAETAAITPGERLRGADSNARASVLAAERVGTTGTLALGRVTGRFFDNEVLVGSRGGAAKVKGNLRGFLNRELLKFMLEVNRPCSERYDLVYISFLDEFTTPRDLDQWDYLANFVSVPEPGGAAVVQPHGTMICNDPQAPMADVDGDGQYDKGWNNYSARWKLTGQLASGWPPIIDLVFHWTSWNACYFVRYDLASKLLYLIKVAGGVPTMLASSQVQAYLKVGVQDMIRVDVHDNLDLGGMRCRVVLDGEEVIPWTNDLAPASPGGPVGLRVNQGLAQVKLVEVNTWPTETGTRIHIGEV